MASIKLQDLTIFPAQILGKRRESVQVVHCSYRYKINPETNEVTQALDGVNVDIVAIQGKVQTVKLPLECRETVDKIAGALKHHKEVTVNFGNPSTLRGKCYAFHNTLGKLLAGVSVTASEINIEKIEDTVIDEEDFIDLE